MRGLKPYQEFEQRVLTHRYELGKLINDLNSKGKTIIGYGASTKGNVILQYCNINEKDMPFIAEVNADKFGCYTPKTNIPIISEEEARKINPDYFLVLPWYFKNSFLRKEADYLKKGGSFIMPLPEIEIISE